MCVCMQRLPVRVLKTLNVETLCSKYTTALTFRIPSAPQICAGPSTLNVVTLCSKYTTKNTVRPICMCRVFHRFYREHVLCMCRVFHRFYREHVLCMCRGSSTLRAPRLGHAARGMIRDVGASKYLRARLV